MSGVTWDKGPCVPGQVPRRLRECGSQSETEDGASEEADQGLPWGPEHAA